MPEDITRPIRFKDWLPPVLVILVYLSIPLFSDNRGPLFDWLGLPAPDFSEAEPMYFVRTDLHSGIRIMLALIPIAGAVLLGRAIGSKLNMVAILLASVFVLPEAFDALSILARCSDLGTLNGSQCPWESFDDYLFDPWKWSFRGLAIVAILAWVRLVRKVRKERSEKSPAS